MNTLPHSSPSPRQRGTWAVACFLCAIIVASVAVRAPGLSWMIGAAPERDYSFRLDDQRFIRLAHDFEAGMEDGYVSGMTTHLLGLRALAATVVPDPNPLQILRLVTIIYAALTVLLTYLTARMWGADEVGAITAAIFLAAAPMHIANSNFGTADVAAVFYFYLALFVEVKYLKTRDELWFVLAAALTGGALAIKFFLPLLLPLGLCVLVHQGRQLLGRFLSAILLVLGSFETYSLFAYRLSDFQTNIAVLRSDNVFVPGGQGIPQQIVLYSWELIGGLSLPVAGLLLAAALSRAPQAWRWARNVPGLHLDFRDWRSLITPTTLIVSTLGAHAILIITAGIHAVRHELVFLPAACIVAARAFAALMTRLNSKPWLRNLTAVLALSYVTFNAIAVERLFSRDIRAAVSNWAQQSLPSGQTLLTFSKMSRINGATMDLYAQPSSLNSNDLLLTCDLEYNGYLRSRSSFGNTVDGSDLHTGFFWDVYEGKSAFHVVKVFREQPLSLEQYLVSARVLRPIGTFVPRICLILGTGSGLASDSGVEHEDVWPQHFYAGGW